MLMDDTVIIATSRVRFIEKMSLLFEYCAENDMLVNNLKTKFMVVNGDNDDKIAIQIRGNIIDYVEEFYVYLGGIFTDCGDMNSVLEIHAREKMKHLNKLTIFLSTNKDYPFYVKRKVVTAAFNSAIMYGAESWIGANTKPVEVMYLSAIKQLLSVRTTTPNFTCLLECNLPPLNALLAQKQYNFFKTAIEKRSDIANEDPFMFVWSLLKRFNIPLAQKVDAVLEFPDHVERGIAELKRRISASDRTKSVLYSRLNPEFVTHPVYCSRLLIPETYRISFTRLRLTSHNLRSETGRWSRLPAERRLCPCGGIQDEEHIIMSCPKTHALRTALSDPPIFPDILHKSDIESFKYIHEVLNFDYNE